MATDVNIRFIDASNEASSVSIHVADDATDENITSFKSAVEAVTIGNMEKVVKSVHTVLETGTTTVPTNKFAQRELKWLCKYADQVTGDRFRFEAPCPDATKLGSTDFLDLTTGVGATLKSTFEAIARSKNGNQCTLNSVELVGRNV